MKLYKFLLLMVLLAAAGISKAQTTPAITDDDLKKYAVTMDSVQSMQQALNDTITKMVQSNTVMTVARYNELFKVIDDEAKLTEAKATPEEIKFVKDVAVLRTESVARINSTYQALVKDYVGLKTFNTIKKSLETDHALKTKYENVSKELESKGG